MKPTHGLGRMYDETFQTCSGTIGVGLFRQNISTWPAFLDPIPLEYTIINTGSVLQYYL